MKKLSIFDLFAAPVKVLRPFRLQPRRATGRRMQTKQFAEGVIHYSSFLAAYLQPTAAYSRRKERGLPLTRTRIVAGPNGLPLLDAKGQVVTAQFAIPEPWIRVTPRAVKPGSARRLRLANERARV